MKNKRFLIMFIAFFATILFIGSQTSYGALQSNPTTHASPQGRVMQWWIEECRKIETVEGGLGYTETYDETTLVPTSGSNGIDIHMMKSTEYGLMAILAVSGYGNPTTSGVMESTTGNNTGVMLNNAWIYVAGGVEDMRNGRDSRYYDEYIKQDMNSAKRGDILGNATTTNPGCESWRGGKTNRMRIFRGYSYCIRGDSGIFSNGSQRDDIGHSSRAVAVVGEGL